MRRRFYFVPFFPTQPPVSDVLRRWLDDNNLGTETADLLDALNARIDDPNFAIGPSYFMSKRVSDNLYLGRVWEHSILPLLEEHYFGTGRIVADEFSLETVWTSAGLGSIGEVDNAIDVSDLS
jgi:5-methylcytosine-specific restriction protein B